MDEPRIRPATMDDFDATLQMRLEALRDHPEAFGSDYETLLSDPQRWRVRIAAVDAGDQAIFVADEQGALAGMIGVYRSADVKTRHSADIWGVFVRPRWRRTGLGCRLVGTALDWCKRKDGLTVIRLTVESNNTAAIRCYERCGFLASGTMPKMLRIDGKYHDELLMWREV